MTDKSRLRIQPLTTKERVETEAEAERVKKVSDLKVELGLSQYQILLLIQDGCFPGAYKAGPADNHPWLIPESEVEAYKAERAGRADDGSLLWDKPYFTVPEAAEALGVSEASIRKYILAGKFPRLYKATPRPNGENRIPAGDVERLGQER